MDEGTGHPRRGHVWRQDVGAEARVASEEYVRALLGSSTDLLLVTNADGRIQFATGAAESLVGLPAGDLRGWDVGRLEPTPLGSMLHAVVTDATSGPVNVRRVHELSFDEPATRFVEVTATNRLDDPIVGGIVLACRDVTESRSVGLQLKLQAGFLGEVPVVMIATDRLGVITSWNAHAEKVLGWKQREVVGRRVDDVFLPDRIYAKVEELMLAPEPGDDRIEEEVITRAKDGHEVPLYSIIRVVRDDHGTPTATVGVGVDLTERYEAEATNRRLAGIVASATDAILSLDRESRITSWNEGAEAMWGYPASMVIGQVPHFLSVHGRMGPSAAAMARALAGESFEYQSVGVRADGTHRDVHLSVSPLRDARGDIIGVSGILRDITDRLRAERELEARSAQQAAVAALGQRALAGAQLDDLLLDAAAVVSSTLGVEAAHVIEIDPDGNGVLRAAADWSPPRTGVQRYSMTPGSTLHELVHSASSSTNVALGDDAYGREATAAGMQRVLGVRLDGRTGPVGALVVLDTKAEPFNPADTSFVQSVANILASAFARSRVTDAMRHQALHDALTGLPNRTLLLDRLDHALQRITHRGGQAALLFIDLDRFKRINDTLGHAAGDHLLIEAGRRIQRAVRAGDTLARLGGDEFTVLCEDLADTEEAVEVARRLATILAEPMRVAGRHVVLTASIGVALASGPDIGSDDVLRNADLAMYRAKDRGRARIEVFDDAMRSAVVERMEIEDALRAAVDRHEIRTVYQPQVTIAGAAPTGIEALARWSHPVLGPVTPEIFIPVAEDAGLIAALGALVLDQACADLGRLRAHCPALTLAVNVSARQLTDPDLPLTVTETLLRHKLPAAALTLEVTESAILEDQDRTLQALGTLRNLGVRISIDDFGTGFSSLSHLATLPVDEVKIDRSFTDGLGRDERPSAIVAGVIAMAHALALHVVAEGVEQESQVDLLRVLGCDTGQGWYWTMPCPIDEVAEWLEAQVARAAVDAAVDANPRQ